MRKALKALLFFVGWILSPLTWWNDAFVNIPLSYLLANLLFYITPFPFRWLVIGSYWFTNIAGILMMYFGGKHIVMPAKNRIKATAMLLAFVVLYSTLMIYLDNRGKLMPLCKYFGKYCVEKKR